MGAWHQREAWGRGFHPGYQGEYQGEYQGGYQGCYQGNQPDSITAAASNLGLLLERKTAFIQDSPRA
jgi:hypothetical protein